MANIDQRKYLKKYLDDDEAKHRKKKKREHSSSHSGRVKIVDDDAGYTRTRKYDDDDLTLTGEDAPQIAGIIDERPPELQAAEDFRNSSKWRTLGESADRSSRAEGRSFGTSSKNNDRRRTKSPPPPRRDNSPGRRKAYKNLSSSSGRKRHSDDDYSPVRRKRDDEARTREANYCKGERNTTSSDDSYARRREEIGRSTGGSDFGHRRQVEHSDRDSQGRHRLTHYTRHHHYSSQPSAQSRSTHHENKGKGYSNENGRDEYLKSIRSEPVKSNPFRANLPSAQPTVSSSSRDGHNRAVSPAKSGNPFRSNPRNISLSPLPERRGNNSGNDIKRGPRSQKNVDKRHSKSEFRQNSPEMDHTGRHNFNPFRTDKPREMDSNAVARSSAISITKPARTETAQTYRTGSHYRISNRSDQSPTQRKCNESDEDLSPIRRKNRHEEQDLSPVQRRIPNKHSASLTRKSRDDDDLSPIRKKAGERNNQNDIRGSGRKTRWNSDDDLSPIRRKLSASPPPDQKNPFHSRNRHGDSLDDGNNTKMKKTLDGKRAGLQDAKMLKKETDEFRRREDELFNNMSNVVSGRDAEVVVRDKKSGRVRDLEKVREKEEEKEKRDKERAEIYKRWGKGLKQVEDYRNRITDDQHESNKPLARYSNDADLDKMLRDQERADDPMLEYMRQKKAKTTNTPQVPTYKGPFPENRFNIRPGYRWDGVDRSNGYEKKWLNVQNQKVATQEEAYRYSTEDM